MSDDQVSSGESQLSHLDSKGAPRMVDVTDKDPTHRTASAEGYLVLSTETLRVIQEGGVSKGNVYEVARLAGIMAAKNTPQMIPLCHPIRLSGVRVDIAPVVERLPEGPGFSRIRILAEVKATDRTGVEMEALSAVSVAALTFYDMIKAIEKGARIEGIRLLSKTGGRSGEFKA